jgi:DNA (cytosine-5)-methyltransferase 1
MIRILDLYCGMGGLSLGFALGIQGAVIRGLDRDGDAVATYNMNLRRLNCEAAVQDVLRWLPSGRYDVVIGGPPCQPFTVSNVIRVGESHPLFPTLPRYFDAVTVLRPLAFVFENVLGLASPRHGRHLKTQLAKVSGEYRVKVGRLNAAEHGVPQRRRRLIVVGIRRDVDGEFMFPRRTHGEAGRVTLDGEVTPWVTLREAVGDLAPLPPAAPGAKPDKLLYRDSCGNLVELNWLPYQSKHPPLSPDKPSPTIMGYIGKWSRCLLVPVSAGGKVIYRRLAVEECLRLQSFPGWWRFPAKIGVTKRYMLVGDATPPILAYRLAVSLARALGFEPREPPGEDEWALPYFHRAFADYYGGGGP